MLNCLIVFIFEIFYLKITINLFQIRLKYTTRYKMSKKVLKYLNKSLIFSIFLLVAIFFQNCSDFNFFKVYSALSTSSQPEVDGGGGTYEGKIVLHNQPANFTCEGKYRPASILVQRTDNNWYYTENRPEKCEAIKYQLVQDVEYDGNLQVATYKGSSYVPPTQYTVNVTANANTSDVDLDDGVCADIDGLCSLRASIEQAASVNFSNQFIIQLPAAHFLINSPLKITNSNRIDIIGSGANVSVIDGQHSTMLLDISGQNVHLSKLSLINGNTPDLHFFASAFQVVSGTGLGTLALDDVIISGNKTMASATVFIANRNVIFNKVTFKDNQNTNVNISGVAFNISQGSFQATELKLINNTTPLPSYNKNIYIGKINSADVILSKVTASGNAAMGTLSISNCPNNCSISNSTFSQNVGHAITVGGNYLSPSIGPLVLQNLTLHNNSPILNSKVTGILANNYTNFPLRVQIENTIVSTSNSNVNCDITGTNTSVITLTNSLVTDSTCGATGSGNIFVSDPMLGGLSNNGGFGNTLMPLTGSPVIDAGNNALCSIDDQNNQSRPVDKLGQGAICDIGAVEAP